MFNLPRLAYHDDTTGHDVIYLVVVPRRVVVVDNYRVVEGNFFVQRGGQFRVLPNLTPEGTSVSIRPDWAERHRKRMKPSLGSRL